MPAFQPFPVKRLFLILSVVAIFTSGVWWGRMSASLHDDAGKDGRDRREESRMPVMTHGGVSIAPPDSRGHADADATWRRVRAAIACREFELQRNLLMDFGEGEEAGVLAARRQNDLAALRVECGDATFSSWSAVARDLERAARQGSIEARLDYATEPLLPPAHMAADVDAWITWRDHAPGYFDEAIARGDARAAALVALARDAGACLPPQTDMRCVHHDTLGLLYRRSRDDSEAMAYYLVAHALGDRTPYLDERLVTLGARLEPAALVAARERAAEILGRPLP